MRLSLSIVCLGSLLASSAAAQESPYFVTYDHHMEEPRTLEIAITPVAAAPRGGHPFTASALELEFAPRAWWTSELYLDGQTTAHESSLFTGYRIENRFRLLMEEHAVNPVLYVEFENISGADKVLREFVGFDSHEDLAVPNSQSRLDRKKEIETKLILSRDSGGWNTSANIVSEKDLSGAPWEFGYAVGASRPLALAATPEPCAFCAENFTLGIEAYGGVGDQNRVTLAGTSHYVAPCVSWILPSGLTLRVSPAFGLTGNSNRFLMRFGVSYELPLASN